MTFPASIWLLLAAALLISSIGFYKYVYFISLGYGFSISGLGILMLILFAKQLSPGTIICCVLFIIYGIRLGGYLLIRELKSATYRSTMKTEIKDGKHIPFGVKCSIWVTCALLYMLQVSAVYYRLFNDVGSNVWTYVGAAVMLFGLSFESIADLQKNKAKKLNPKRFVDTGLFRIVRCPNYLGEMTFWTGVLISGIGAVSGIGQWIVVLVGYAGIIFVMFSGARRLELRQDKNYGSDPEYQKFVTTVPILLPFVPLYSVKKYKFLVA